MGSAADEPVLKPSRFIAYVARRQGLNVSEMRLPRPLLVFYSWRTFEFAQRLAKAKTVKWWYAGSRLASGSYRGVPLSIYSMPIGASASTMNLEELLACGVQDIIEIGTCGSIVRSIKPGSLLVVERAFSDEGTSRHYFSRQRTFLATPELTGRLSSALAPLGASVGAVWTTDSPYRETRKKVAKFRTNGAIGVNMETSALFAVARFRKARIASVQVVTDTVTEDLWRPAFHIKKVRQMSDEAIKAALGVLADSGKNSMTAKPK